MRRNVSGILLFVLVGGGRIGHNVAFSQGLPTRNEAAAKIIGYRPDNVNIKAHFLVPNGFVIPGYCEDELCPALRTVLARLQQKGYIKNYSFQESLGGMREGKKHRMDIDIKWNPKGERFSLGTLDVPSSRGTGIPSSGPGAGQGPGQTKDRQTKQGGQGQARIRQAYILKCVDDLSSVTITGIKKTSETTAVAEFTVKPTAIYRDYAQAVVDEAPEGVFVPGATFMLNVVGKSELKKYVLAGSVPGYAYFELYDDGWRVAYIQLWIDWKRLLDFFKD